MEDKVEFETFVRSATNEQIIEYLKNVSELLINTKFINLLKNDIDNK